MSILPSAGTAQIHSADNRFFGFEFILEPLALKWACGGKRKADLVRLQTLIDAFPEDAEQAGLSDAVDFLAAMPEGNESLEKLLHPDFPPGQTERVCDAVAPLNVDWIDPQQIGSDDQEIPDDQRPAWLPFCVMIETIHVEAAEAKKKE